MTKSKLQRKFEILRSWLIRKEETYDGLLSHEDIANQIDRALDAQLEMEEREDRKAAFKQRLKNGTRYGSM